MQSGSALPSVAVSGLVVLINYIFIRFVVLGVLRLTSHAVVLNLSNLFLSSTNVYLSGVCCLPGIVLGPGVIVVNKIDNRKPFPFCLLWWNR